MRKNKLAAAFDGEKDNALVKELPLKPPVFIDDRSTFHREFHYDNETGSVTMKLGAEAKASWLLWELPALSKRLSGDAGKSDLPVFVFFSARIGGSEEAITADLKMLEGVSPDNGMGGLSVISSLRYAHTDCARVSALMRVRKKSAHGTVYLSLPIQGLTGLCSFSAPEVTWTATAAPCQAPYVIHVSSCTVQDFTLKVEGWVRDAFRPGFPVRIALLAADVEKKISLARTAIDADTPAPPGSFKFELVCTLSEAELKSQIHIAAIAPSGHVCLTPVGHIQERKAGRGAAPVKVAPRSGRLAGKVEHIQRESVSGWACNENAPDSIADLMLFVDDKPFSYTQCNKHRRDVKKKRKGHGFYGFSFENPPNIAISAPVAIRVEGCLDRAKLKNNTGIINPAAPVDLPAIHKIGSAYPVIKSAAEDKKLSIIILNQNGALILDEMLRSAENIDDYADLEWIVVDHQSNDRSELVCLEALARGFDIRFLHRNGNFSFSDSNNYGAAHASGDILIFANNDLVFIEPFTQKIRRYLSDATIGALGVKLLDRAPEGTGIESMPIQHLGVFFRPDIIGEYIRPYEARLVEEIAFAEQQPVLMPCVTAAFLAMRRSDFVRVGGFDTSYRYGLEDVDLCLKVRSALAKAVVSANDLAIIHRRGFSRNRSVNAALLKKNNNKRLNAAWGAYLRRSIRRDVLVKPGFWTGSRPVIAFIVTNTDSAGDYYTAMEFGKALHELYPVHVRFIGKKDWYDLTGVDVLIVMVKDFDITRAENAGPFLVTVNWMRQWFDIWAERPDIHAYDYLFASSYKAADYISEKTGRKVNVLRLASNTKVFAAGKYDPYYASDYCFTGGFFNLAREIQFQLDPGAVQRSGAVYGDHWEGTSFEPISRGSVPYSCLPDVYASTKVVLDDANIATKPWGSCNSRVFDSLAAGCLLMTNGADGVQELFGDLVPTFHDSRTLHEGLDFWLENDELRQKRVKLLQDIVFKEHSYRNRAKTFFELLENQAPPVRIAIKCPAEQKDKEKWGDYHFANALAKELRKKGYAARVDLREQWDCAVGDSDDVVLLLRGVLSYQPRRHQINLLWLISHPDDVSTAELSGYDHVYCASAYHCELLSRSYGLRVEFLPQCVDPSRFNFVPERVNSRPKRVLFVGNSRGVFRDCVKWAVEKGLDIDIYGNGWEPFISDQRLKGRLLPNEVLGEAYASSKYVLCDHWEDMKQLGYVSNRVFDVLAAGGMVLVDNVKGIHELVPSGYTIFHDADEFENLISKPARLDLEERKKTADWVVRHHSFAARADTIDAQIRGMYKR